MPVNIEDNVKRVRERVGAAAVAAGRAPEDVTLVAACKTNSAEAVRRAIAAGITVCGENRVQEMVEKSALGAYSGAKLHFIGHLQRNKVRQVVGLCDLIQSADSVELLRLINDRAAALGIVQDALIEINIAGEASKSGIAPSELSAVLETAAGFANICIRGLMAIPPILAKNGSNSVYFERMYKLYIDNSAEKYDNVFMDFLSMGMSGDFEAAISAGGNMIRVGSAIFGERV